MEFHRSSWDVEIGILHEIGMVNNKDGKHLLERLFHPA